jgi:hypothetical protein
MSQADTVTLGESASVVSKCDEALCVSAKELVWSSALSESDAGSTMLKLTVDMAYLRRLRLRCRVALMTLASSRSDASQITGPELFWMSVNDYLHSESGREFRLPMGSSPIHRTNSRGRIMCRTGSVLDRYHPNVFVNSLMLCLMNACGVAHCVGWVPVHVNYAAVQNSLKLMRNRERGASSLWMAMGHSFADIFYAALLVLLCNGLIRGEVRRMVGHPGSGSRVMPDWFQASARVAVGLGLLSSPMLELGVLCLVQLSCYVDAPIFDSATFVINVPRFIENPTAFMEKMWYLQDFAPLIHHCCYCRYGDSYRKPSTYWLSGFSWPQPLMCNPASPCDHFAVHGCHAERIGGSIGHSMAQKWSVPFELCLELLQCMLAVRPGGRWFLTLFGGQGSFDRACRMLGLVHVSVSFDRPSHCVEGTEGSCVHVWMDLKKFTVGEVMTRVWHLTGLAPGDLVGLASHPGCETFSFMSARRGGRDHGAEGFHLALDDASAAADELTWGAFAAFFPDFIGWFMGKYMEGMLPALSFD